MRIVAGYLGSRALLPPPSGVRPTSERVRESIFSRLGDVSDCRVLDLFAGTGARVTELVVPHRPRRHGSSKYGIGRTLRVVLDMFTVTMISSFSERPLRYFAFLALPFLCATLVVGVTAPQELIGGGAEFGLDTLAVLAFMLPFMACAYFILLGLLAELIVKASDVHRTGAHGVQIGGLE